MSKLTKIGVAGFSGRPFDQEKATRLLNNIFESLLEQYDVDDLEIVSGYTNIGIPRLAYLLADKLGITTVGITAKEALNVDCGLYPVKKVMIEGENFGDESEAFINYIDILIRIGGGNQSLKEVKLFKQENNESDLRTILFEEHLDELK